MRYLVLAALLAVAAPVAAQTATVVNPTVVSFTPSPDHNIVLAGVPVLDHYEVNTLIGSATGVISWSENIGKPAPNASNTIEAAVPRFASLSRGSYVVTVSAVGPGGGTPSAATDPFIETGPPAAVPGKPITIKK